MMSEFEIHAKELNQTKKNYLEDFKYQLLLNYSLYTKKQRIFQYLLRFSMAAFCTRFTI